VYVIAETDPRTGLGTEHRFVSRGDIGGDGVWTATFFETIAEGVTFKPGVVEGEPTSGGASGAPPPETIGPGVNPADSDRGRLNREGSDAFARAGPEYTRHREEIAR
jgi:hypothetical protein